jgi:hypothetical protein
LDLFGWAHAQWRKQHRSTQLNSFFLFFATIITRFRLKTQPFQQKIESINVIVPPVSSLSPSIFRLFFSILVCCIQNPNSTLFGIYVYVCLSIQEHCVIDFSVHLINLIIIGENRIGIHNVIMIVIWYLCICMFVNSRTLCNWFFSAFD